MSDVVSEVRVKTDNPNEFGVIRWKNNGFQLILETQQTETAGGVGDTTTQQIDRKILAEFKNE